MPSVCQNLCTHTTTWLTCEDDDDDDEGLRWSSGLYKEAPTERHPSRLDVPSISLQCLLLLFVNMMMMMIVMFMMIRIHLVTMTIVHPQTNVGPILISVNPYTDVGNALTLNSTREAAKNSEALLKV